MASPARLVRQKISTTISSASLSYLERLIEKGEARNLAEAISAPQTRLQRDASLPFILRPPTRLRLRGRG